MDNRNVFAGDFTVSEGEGGLRRGSVKVDQVGQLRPSP